jgi:hypothetical protein
MQVHSSVQIRTCPTAFSTDADSADKSSFTRSWGNENSSRTQSFQTCAHEKKSYRFRLGIAKRLDLFDKFFHDRWAFQLPRVMTSTQIAFLLQKDNVKWT